MAARAALIRVSRPFLVLGSSCPNEQPIASSTIEATGAACLLCLSEEDSHCHPVLREHQMFQSIPPSRVSCERTGCWHMLWRACNLGGCRILQTTLSLIITAPRKDHQQERDESVLFPPSFTSNLELIHISVLETDMPDVTEGMAGPPSKEWYLFPGKK